MNDDLPAFHDLHGKLAAMKQTHSKQGSVFQHRDRRDKRLTMPEHDPSVDREGALGAISQNTEHLPSWHEPKTSDLTVR